VSRELVLDTETTGLDFEDGHRLVEIGIIELENHIPTGNHFHHYLNPERDSDLKAEQIHGLSKEFLKNKPRFCDIVDEFVEFISDSTIIIHNASFDVGFINLELSKCNRMKLDENLIIDTLELAKKKFPGQSVSLDSLCRKYNIDLTNREIHGGLKDAKLLASVYLELIGGRQSKLEFEKQNISLSNLVHDSNTINIDYYYENLPLRAINNVKIDKQDYKMHLNSIESIKNSIWKKLND
tara:strand:+ start:148 stop:864 length:717 start_codon:yes stop_codon:yes gene_type:complete